MKIVSLLFYLCFAVAPAMAQTSPSESAPAASPQVAGSASMTPILPDLDRLQAAASQAAIEIGHMRIEKWKTSSQSKQQAQANADSIQRNLTSALPGMIDAVRSSPQDLSAEFKLYRNLNVLYDVMASLTESAGAFGPTADYEALARPLQVVDSVRRDLGDALEQLAASTQSELTRLRARIHLQQQAAAAAPPKKVVVDDNEPPNKAARKKRSAKKKPSASGPSSSTSAGAASARKP
jgi:BMFP domain-containing protein YqiC